METPSSARRVTRSQTLAASNNSNNGVYTLRKLEESENVLTKSRQRNNGKQQQDRSALIDITNDSPIVGLAMGSLGTPSSTMSKKRFISRTNLDCTPGSGEALLRGQVKTLLQKVEEEAELTKLSFENRPFAQIQGFFNSPLAFIAPTPANTPQILNLSANGNSQSNGLDTFNQSPVEDKFVICQMVSEISEGKKKQEEKECENNLMITRSLLLDFSEKSEGSAYSSEGSSEVFQGGDTEGRERATATDDDDASIWSIQVNASTKDDQEEDDEEVLDEVEEECDNEYFDEEEDNEEKEDDAGYVDELCEAISQINVNYEGRRSMAKFAGKHIRFLYNSDDELEGEVEDCGVESESAAAPTTVPLMMSIMKGVMEDCSVESEESTAAASTVPLNLKLKGLPTPKGKHLRFPDD